RSSTLSHLFSQGMVSAILLNDYPEYRHKIIDLLPEDWRSIIDPLDLDKSAITFVYAISSNKDEPLSKSLPFFSKVSLRQHKKEIERMGFKVTLCRIAYSDG
ncbi:MAG: TIGR04141 family sporadically distributed protein, partial [Anaerolineae bacterium]|nr:TIGR04141 family sporadically distributed protein [Anaerolineae bacterium]